MKVEEERRGGRKETNNKLAKSNVYKNGIRLVSRVRTNESKSDDAG